MIPYDQPTIFGDEITTGLSSCDDGTMRFSSDDDQTVSQNREAFLSLLGIDPQQASLVRVTYDTTDFTRYAVADDTTQGDGIAAPAMPSAADALVAVRPGQALFLLLADCAGAIIFDTANRILMVSHLGRHNLEAQGGTKSIRYLVDEFGSRPAELKVWISPAVGRESYPLFSLCNRGIHEVVLQQLQDAGVPAGNIEVCRVDTAASPDYFSHSDYLAGNRTDDGRFAIAAMMRE